MRLRLRLRERVVLLTPMKLLLLLVLVSLLVSRDGRSDRGGRSTPPAREVVREGLESAGRVAPELCRRLSGPEAASRSGVEEGRDAESVDASKDTRQRPGCRLAVGKGDEEAGKRSRG